MIVPELCEKDQKSFDTVQKIIDGQLNLLMPCNVLVDYISVCVRYLFMSSYTWFYSW